MGLPTSVTYIRTVHKRTPGDRSLNIEKLHWNLKRNLSAFIDTTETNKTGNLSASKRIKNIAEKIYHWPEKCKYPFIGKMLQPDIILIER